MSNPKFISKSGLTKNDICNYMLSEIESYNRPQHKTTIHHSKHYYDDINDYRKYMDTSSDLDELDELEAEQQRQWDEQEEYEQKLRDIHEKYPDFDDRRAAYLGEDPETAERTARTDDYLNYWF